MRHLKSNKASLLKLRETLADKKIILGTEEEESERPDSNDGKNVDHATNGKEEEGREVGDEE